MEKSIVPFPTKLKLHPALKSVRKNIDSEEKSVSYKSE
jgi:hypothetical protein